MSEPEPPQSNSHPAMVEVAINVRTGPRLLLVDRDPQERARLCRTLESRFDICEAGSAEEALARLGERWFQIILTDYELGDQTGVWLLEQVKRTQPHMLRTLASAVGVPRCFTLHEEGLFWLFLPKPVDPNHFADFVLGLDH